MRYRHNARKGSSSSSGIVSRGVPPERRLQPAPSQGKAKAKRFVSPTTARIWRRSRKSTPLYSSRPTGASTWARRLPARRTVRHRPHAGDITQAVKPVGRRHRPLPDLTPDLLCNFLNAFRVGEQTNSLPNAVESRQGEPGKGYNFVTRCFLLYSFPTKLQPLVPVFSSTDKNPCFFPKNRGAFPMHSVGDTPNFRRSNFRGSPPCAGLQSGLPEGRVHGNCRTLRRGAGYRPLVFRDKPQCFPSQGDHLFMGSPPVRK